VHPSRQRGSFALNFPRTSSTWFRALAAKLLVLSLRLELARSGGASWDLLVRGVQANIRIAAAESRASRGGPLKTTHQRSGLRSQFGRKGGRTMGIEDKAKELLEAAKEKAKKITAATEEKAEEIKSAIVEKAKDVKNAVEKKVE
jgi:hypothetical protein